MRSRGRQWALIAFLFLAFLVDALLLWIVSKNMEGTSAPITIESLYLDARERMSGR